MRTLRTDGAAASVRKLSESLSFLPLVETRGSLSRGPPGRLRRAHGTGGARAKRKKRVRSGSPLRRMRLRAQEQGRARRSGARRLGRTDPAQPAGMKRTEEDNISAEKTGSTAKPIRRENRYPRKDGCGIIFLLPRVRRASEPRPGAESSRSPKKASEEQSPLATVIDYERTERCSDRRFSES